MALSNAEIAAQLDKIKQQALGIQSAINALPPTPPPGYGTGSMGTIPLYQEPGRVDPNAPPVVPVDPMTGKPPITPVAPAPTVPVRTPRDEYLAQEQARIDAAASSAQTERETANAARASALQRELDRIDSETNARIAEQQKTGVINLAKTRGINIRAGLAGSPFADALKGEVTAATDKAIASERQRGDQLKGQAQGNYDQSIAQIETNYTNRQAQIESARSGLLKTRVDFTDAEQKQALGDFTALAGMASSASDVQKLDEAGFLKGYAAQTGKSEYELRRLWMSSLPDKLKPIDHVSYVDDGNGGTIMKRVSFDPITKKVMTEDVPIAAPITMFNTPDKPIEVNGMLLVKQADGTYKNVAPVNEQKAAMDAADLKLKNSQIAKNYADINKITKDTSTQKQLQDSSTKLTDYLLGKADKTTHYVSANDYKTARDAWMKDFAGDKTAIESFDSLFGNFVDPAKASDYGIKWKAAAPSAFDEWLKTQIQ